MKEIIVSKEYHQIRCDKLIFKILKEASKGYIYKMYRKKNIVVNEKKITGKERLQEGDRIRFYLSDETFNKFSGDSTERNNEKVSEDQSLSLLVESLILYEDEELLVYNKPCNLLSQPNGKDENLIDQYVEYMKRKNLLEGQDYQRAYGVCNRLDRNTTGVILIGKNAFSLRTINEAIKKKQVEKVYHAVVKGSISEPLDLRAYLEKKKTRNKVVIRQEAVGDQIHTKVRPISVSGDGKYTLCEVNILTGKSHQIRAHLASVGHPLIGDGKYGDKVTNDYFRKNYDIRFQMLHSYSYTLHFKEQSDLKQCAHLDGQTFKAPYFETFEKVVSGLFSNKE